MCIDAHIHITLMCSDMVPTLNMSVLSSVIDLLINT